jgi:uncharacterized protein YggU (UPF0235/DUF167 family)
MVKATRLEVTVTPGARRSEIAGRYGDGWKVRVPATAERGRANDAVLELLAGALGIRRRELELVAGGTARRKVVAVTGLTAEEVDERLARAATSGR